MRRNLAASPLLQIASPIAVARLVLLLWRTFHNSYICYASLMNLGQTGVTEGLTHLGSPIFNFKAIDIVKLIEIKKPGKYSNGNCRTRLGIRSFSGKIKRPVYPRYR